MSESEKIEILKDVFGEVDSMNEKDRIALMAYIKGTIDTRERIEMENRRAKKS